jgi:hypothetical protein
VIAFHGDIMHSMTYVYSPFGHGSFNGKPKASANPAHSRLRLAVKQAQYFVSVANQIHIQMSETQSSRYP